MSEDIWTYLIIIGVVLLIVIYVIIDKIKVFKPKKALKSILEEKKSIKKYTLEEKNNAKLELKSKILAHENDIKNVFEKINNISDEVKKFEIEIFLINEKGIISVELFSMDNENNQVNSSRNDTFSGSTLLLDNIETINIDILSEKIYKEELRAILMNLIKKYVMHISIPIDITWHDSDDIYTIKLSSDENEYAINILKKILKALHEKKYDKVINYVDESKIEDLTEFLSGPIQETLDINGYGVIDEYGVKCNFYPKYEYSQITIQKYTDSDDFYLEYDLTSNGELIDLVLQLDFKHTKDGLKCLFENIDPQ